ncbi:unnamed protein product, partial [marine sediment metagenome]
MFEPHSLSKIILSKQTIEDLYKMNLQSQNDDIEREIKHRLISCDPELSIPVINFLYTYRNDKVIKEQWFTSIYIIEGLRDAIDCIPWKIGVIYDYRDQTYRINNVSIIVG